MARHLTLDHLGPDTYHAVNVRTLCNVFTNKQIKDRARAHTERLFYGGSIRTPMGRGMRRMMEDVMRVEYQYIKTNLRIVQRKPPRKKPIGIRPPNRYKLFCDEMKEKHPPHTLVGNLQNMVSIVCKHVKIAAVYIKEISSFLTSVKAIYTFAVIVVAHFV